VTLSFRLLVVRHPFHNPSPTWLITCSLSNTHVSVSSIIILFYFPCCSGTHARTHDSPCDIDRRRSESSIDWRIEQRSRGNIDEIAGGRHGRGGGKWITIHYKDGKQKAENARDKDTRRHARASERERSSVEKKRAWCERKCERRT